MSAHVPFIHSTQTRFNLSSQRHYLCCDEYVHEEMPPDPICDPICPYCDTRAPEGRLSHRMGAACFDGTCWS